MSQSESIARNLCSTQGGTTPRFSLSHALLLAALLSAASMAAFYQQTLGTKVSDIPAQFGLAGSSTSASVYSILYLLVEGLWKATANPLIIAWIAIAVLTGFVALK